MIDKLQAYPILLKLHQENSKRAFWAVAFDKFHTPQEVRAFLEEYCKFLGDREGALSSIAYCTGYYSDVLAQLWNPIISEMRGY